MNARIQVTESRLARAVGGDFDGPLGATAVNLAGGITVWVDPLSPARFVRIDAAPLEPGTQEVLTKIIGAEAAAQLAAAAEAAVWDTEFPETHAAIEPSEPVWSGITRLGFLLWLEEYSFLPVDQKDFDIEIGLIAYRMGHLGTWDLADERLTRARPHLIAQTRALAAGESPLHPSSRILVDALDTVLVSYSDDLSGLETSELESVLAVLQNRLVAGDFETVAIAPTQNVLAREDVALAAGLSASAQPETARRNSVDWRRVPRNFLDIEENTIESVWTDDESPHLTVAVAASADSVLSGRVAHSLMFSVTSEATRDALVAGPLRFDEELGLYSGMCRLETNLQPGDHVEVYSVLTELMPAFGAQRDRLLGTREATRGFLSERLPGPDGQFTATALRLDATARYWRRSANAFDDAAHGGDTRDADQARQRTCVARADALAGMEDGAQTSTWIAQLPELALAELAYFRALPNS